MLNQKKLDIKILNNMQQMDLIWSNPNGITSQTSTMGASTVTVGDISAYSGFMCEFRCTYNSGERVYGFDFIGATGMFARQTCNSANGNPMLVYRRDWYPSSTTQITFSDCTRMSSNAANVTGSDTGCLVPMRIWGIRTGA